MRRLLLMLGKLRSILLPPKEEWINYPFKDKLTTIFTYLTILALLGRGMVKLLESEPLPLDYIDANKPYLEVKLEITRIDSTGLQYNYMVKNNGKLPAKNLTFSQRNEGMVMGEFEGSQRDLAPQGEMLVKNTVLSSLTSIQLKNLNKFSIIASYDAHFGEETKSYHSIFTFFIPIDELTQGIIKYDDVRRFEGRFNQVKFGEFLQQEWPKILKKREINSNEIIDNHSYLAILKLQDTNLSRSKFIFDIGAQKNKNRASLFLNKNNDLVFSIVDKNETKDSVFIKYDPQLFESTLMLNCQIGLGENFTVLRLYVNNDLVRDKRIGERLQIDNLDELSEDMQFGMDLSGENGGVFTLMVQDNTNIWKEPDDIKSVVQRQNNRAYNKIYEFKGNNGVKSEQVTINHSFHIYDPNLNSILEEIERFDGSTLLMRMKLLENTNGNIGYIYDSGEKLSNRISIYLDWKNNLVFRVIDNESKLWELCVDYDKTLFNEYYIFYFEIGTSSDYSFMRIILDDKVIERQSYNYNINFIDPIKVNKDFVLGADINLSNNGKFYITELAKLKSTVTNEKIYRIKNDMQKKEQLKTLFFNGTNYFKSNTMKNGNYNLESLENEGPIVLSLN